MTRPNGLILYRGPSLIDGAPIVVIAAGLAKRSRNAKTGAMVQTWILRADINPSAATKTGDDVSICGNCGHRPALGGSCYVKVWQAPRAIWEAFTRGVYSDARDASEVTAAGAGRVVRLGTYGDPGAVPLWVWRALCANAEAVNGYTHQWAARPDLAAYCMASVDSSSEALAAHAMGFRTFRVRNADEPLMPREFACPASHEAGRKTDCASCRACGGHSAKARAHPVIVAHGPTARRFVLYRNGMAA